MIPAALSRTLVILRGLVYGAAFVLLWTWLGLMVRRYDAALPVAIPASLRPLGFALAIAGGFVAALCIAAFVTVGRGTPAPFDPPRAFVAGGPYRYVRNPMYLGAAGVIVGAGIILRSPAVLLLALVFLLIMNGFVMLYEESALRERFGATYTQYTAAVRRWLPRLSPPVLVLLVLALLAGFVLGSVLPGAAIE
jgi:protein-S-isoprenylcysteine O-methyltransferase Ste14